MRLRQLSGAFAVVLGVFFNTILACAQTGIAIDRLPPASVPLSGNERVPLQQGPFNGGQTVRAAVDDLATAVGQSSVSRVDTNAAMKALNTTTALRCGINSVGDAPCATFKWFAGSCASSLLTDDIGYCVDATNGGHWIAQPSDGRLHWAQFGPYTTAQKANGTITLGGSATSTDVVAISFSSPATSVSYIVQPGDTLAKVADGLVTAIYNNSALQTARLYAGKSGNAINIWQWGNSANNVIVSYTKGSNTETATIVQMSGGAGSTTTATANTTAIQHAIDDAYSFGFDTIDDIPGPGCVPITTILFYGYQDGYTPRAPPMGYYGSSGSCLLRTVNGAPGMRSVTVVGGTQVTQQINLIRMVGLTIHGQGLAGTNLLLEGLSNSDFQDLVLDDTSTDATWSYTQTGNIVSSFPSANLMQLSVPNVSQSANNHFQNVYVSMPFTDSTNLHGIGIYGTAANGYTLPLINYNHFDSVLGFFAKTGYRLDSGNDNTLTHTDFGIDTTSYQICTSNQGHFCAHNKLDRPYLDNGCCGQTQTWVSIGTDARQTIVSDPTAGTPPTGNQLVDPGAPATQTEWRNDGLFVVRSYPHVALFYPPNTQNIPTYTYPPASTISAPVASVGSGTITFTGSAAVTMAAAVQGAAASDLTSPTALGINAVVSQVACSPSCASPTSTTLTLTNSTALVSAADLIQVAFASNSHQVVGNNYNQAGYYSTTFSRGGVFDCVHYDGVIGAVSALKNGKQVCSFGAMAYDGSAVGGGAGLSVFATEDWTTSAHGLEVVLQDIRTGTTALASDFVLKDGGAAIGSPTGGTEGAGTLNLAGNLYDNGVAPAGTLGTGYVHKDYVTGLVAPQVGTNAALAAAANATYPNGVWRRHYAAGGFADGPLFFQPQTGTCAANSWVNDGGNCVDSTSGDGNSWKALHQSGILNVKEFGALGDQSTDDHTALQNAINAAGALSLPLQWSYGNYCNKASTLNVTAPQTWRGTNRQAGLELQTCGADINLLNLNATAIAVHDMNIAGPQIVGTTHDAVTFGANCIECLLEDLTVTGGRHSLNWQSGEAYINNVKMYQAYDSQIYIQGGGYIRRAKLDNVWPAAGGAPNQATLPSNAPATWAATTAYTARTSVVCLPVANCTGNYAGAYFLQAMTSGTSGGAAPTLLPYNQTITDGGSGLTWQLAGPASQLAGGLQIDDGSAALVVSNTDISSTYYNGAALTNTHAGIAPQSITFDNDTFGTFYQNAIQTVAGSFGLSVTNSQNISNGLSGNSTAVNIYGDHTIVANNHIFSVRNPIVLQAGSTNTTVSGDVIGGCTNGVLVVAGVSYFRIEGETFGSALLGACANSVNVAAGGSDHYNIVNNILAGASAISDSGTGTNKTIMGNN